MALKGGLLIVLFFAYKIPILILNVLLGREHLKSTWYVFWYEIIFSITVSLPGEEAKNNTSGNIGDGFLGCQKLIFYVIFPTSNIYNFK